MRANALAELWSQRGGFVYVDQWKMELSFMVLGVWFIILFN